MSLLYRTLTANKCVVNTRYVTTTHLRFRSSSQQKNREGDSQLQENPRETQHVQTQTPSVVIKPVRQGLIKKIPVEFHGVRPSKFDDHTEWYPIFRSPYVNVMRTLIKLKVYLTTFSVSSSIFYTSQMLIGATLNPWKAVILSSLTLAGLVLIGDYARRLIVQIYVSKDLEYVRFCRFTFFGRRRDIVVPRECIVKLTEVNASQRQPILNIKFTLPEKGIDVDLDYYEFYELGFRLPLALGGVLDRDKFNAALGKILLNKLS